MRYFTNTVGRKIGITYLLICSLFFLIGLVTLLRLNSMANMIDNLATTLNPAMMRSQNISASLKLADDLAQTYMRDKSRDTLDRLAMTFEEMNMHLSESLAGQTPPDPALVDLETNVHAYQQAFQELARETNFQQMLLHGALQVERSRIEDQLSALRIAVAARPAPQFFLIFDNARTAVNQMMLAFTEYAHQGDGRFAVLLKTEAVQAQQEFSHLGQTLGSDRARLAAQEGVLGIGAFLDSFDRIRASNDVQHQLIKTIDTELKPRIDISLNNLQQGFKEQLTTHTRISRGLLKTATLELLIALSAALLIVASVGYYLTRNITAPLRAVAITAETVANRDLQQLCDNLISMAKGNTSCFFHSQATALDIDRNDEVGQMARSFDHIITQLAETENAFNHMALYLHEMASTATAVARGDLDVEIMEPLPDDLLGQAMVTMVRNLARTQEKVSRYQHQLHELVDERTTQLREATLRAESATAAKSVFLARMSHEIRTPLNGILSMAELARESCSDPVVADYLKKVLSSARTLLALLNDILDFSKIEAGRMQLECSSFELDTLLENMADLSSSLAEEKGLDFIISVNPDVPYSFQGDPLRLGQILNNLVSNAIKFTHRGSVSVSISLAEERGEHCRLHVEIADTGIGIAPEALSTLFESFCQADQSTSRKYGGTGLGLSICKSLIELMQGRIWVHSTPGEGTSFHFTVLLARQQTQGMIDLSAFRNKRILVVDSTPATRENLRTLLAAASFSVACADSCESAQCALERGTHSEPFDLLVLDSKLPGSDGLTCVKRLLASCGHLPPTILATTQLTPQLAAAAGQLGIHRILQKPVIRTDLWQTLNQTLHMPSAVERRVPAPKAPAGPRFDGTRVLVVEDNRINQEVARALLQKVGIQVTLADSGQSALDLVHTHAYDLILMDIQMPGMDGLEATRRLRAEEQFRDLPILAMTAHALPSDREASRAAGMNEHLTKPITPASLYEALTAWLAPTKNKAEATGPEPLPARLHTMQHINASAALARIDGDTPYFLHLIDQFVDRQTNFSDRLGQALRSENYQEALKLVRDLGQTCRTLGADACAEAASRLENALQQSPDNAVGHAVPLNSALDALLQELQGLGQSPSTGSG